MTGLLDDDESRAALDHLDRRIEENRRASLEPILLANGGWCSPSEAYPLAGDHGGIDYVIPNVTARRAGMTFTNPPEFPKVDPEKVAARRAEEARLRAERKAAGGEWHYGLRQPDGTVVSGSSSSSWEPSYPFLTVDDARNEGQWYIDCTIEECVIVRRWHADPPEWEDAEVAL